MGPSNGGLFAGTCREKWRPEGKGTWRNLGKCLSIIFTHLQIDTNHCQSLRKCGADLEISTNSVNHIHHRIPLGTELKILKTWIVGACTKDLSESGISENGLSYPTQTLLSQYNCNYIHRYLCIHIYIYNIYIYIHTYIYVYIYIYICIFMLLFRFIMNVLGD